MIQVKNLVKTYKTGNSLVPVLKGLSFSIQRSEFVAIMGKSGSGKSTLLYQMSLLDVPTSGEVILDGIQTKEFSEQDRVSFRLKDLGFVFQEYALIPSLTAIENVVTALLMRNHTLESSMDMAKETLEGVGLGDKLNNTPSQLSGGQQQRVSIARAIVHKPKILFADEPTANLDSQISRQILSIFEELHRNGQTIVMVTHESEYAKVADRILTLEDGVIVGDKKKRK